MSGQSIKAQNELFFSVLATQPGFVSGMGLELPEIRDYRG